jgi:hypothetical protein
LRKKLQFAAKRIFFTSCSGRYIPDKMKKTQTKTFYNILVNTKALKPELICGEKCSA